MGIYEELQARGLIAQVTNEPEIREMVNTGKATFYIGFDPTADSLHVGHFMALCLMKRLQMAGNRPVVLVGGGTFRADNPCLTARIPGETVEQQPLACVLTSRLPNPAGDIHLLKERPHQAVFLCSPAAAASTAAHALRQMGVRVLALGPGQRGCPDFPTMFHMLYEDLHCPYVLCEGGGHLALSGAVLVVPGLPEQPRPNAVILGYPVITAGQYAHRGSFVQLAGEDPAAQQAFSLEDKITPRTPPVFVWHTMEDETVPVENTLLLVSALHRAGVPCEAHLFEKGCHGTSLSTAEVNHPSAHRSRWLTLAREWLDDTFDFHLGTGEMGG